MLAVTFVLKPGSLSVGMASRVLDLMTAAGDPTELCDFGVDAMVAFARAHGARLWKGSASALLSVIDGLPPRQRGYVARLFVAALPLVALPEPVVPATAVEHAWHPHAHLVSRLHLQELVASGVVCWAGGDAVPTLSGQARKALHKARNFYLHGTPKEVVHVGAAGLLPTAAPTATLTPTVPSAGTWRVVRDAWKWSDALGACHNTDAAIDMCKDVLRFSGERERACRDCSRLR